MATASNLPRVRSDFVHSNAATPQKDPELLLSDDWEKTAYVPPSIHRAKSEAAQKKLLQGRGSFCSVDLTTTGPGVSLYFKLLERNILFFLVSTILVLPSVYLMYVTRHTKSKSSQGQQILDDPMQLSTLSLGSLDGNTTLSINNRAVEPPVIGMVVVVVDLLIVFCFLIMTYVFGKDIDACTEDNHSNKDTTTNNDRNVHIGDFSIYVTGLPLDVHTKDVQTFFSDHYQLAEPDWEFEGYCGCLRILSRTHRLPTDQEGRGVVMTVDEEEDSDEERDDERDDEEDNTKEAAPLLVTTNPIYQPTDPNSEHNLLATAVQQQIQHESEDPRASFAATGASRSWVAETTLVRKDGDLIRHFMSMKTIVKQSITKRAKIKQLRQRVHDATMAVAALKEQTKDEQQTQPHHQQDCLRLSKKVNKATQRLQMARKKYADMEQNIRDKVEWFNSKQNILQARPVVGAFVVFNNEQSRARCLLDYSGSDRWFWNWLQVPPLRFQGHRLVVQKAVAPGDVVWENHGENACYICCRRTLTMIVSLILIVGAAVMTQQYVHIKTLLFPTALPSYADCQLSGSSTHVDWLMQCTNASMPLPTVNSTTAPGSAPASSAASAASTARSTLAQQRCTQCYCMELTVDALASSNIIQAVGLVVKQQACTEFAVLYGSGQAMAFVAAFIVVVVNSMLRMLLRCMSTFERYTSLTKQQAQLAFKLFVVQTLNTAIIVVLVNAKISKVDANGHEVFPTWATPLKTMGFLAGAMGDMNEKWFVLLSSLF